MELWATTAADAMNASIATGNTVSFGETGMQAKEEWWYPIYMKEQCPGLPDWKALNDCAELFATPETAPKGRYLGGPVTWGGYDEERIAALGLNYEVIHAGTDAAMFAELEWPISARTRSCCGSTPRTGRRSSMRANGLSSRLHARVLHRPRSGREPGRGL